MGPFVEPHPCFSFRLKRIVARMTVASLTPELLQDVAEIHTWMQVEAATFDHHPHNPAFSQGLAGSVDLLQTP